MTLRRPPTNGEGDAAGDLVRRAAASDQAAWTALVERFGGLIWSVARAHGLDRWEAADVSQTVWLRLADHVDRLRDPDRVGAWLAATTRHEAIRVSRLGRRTTLTADPEALDGVEPAVDQDASGTALLDDERAAALWAVVATMPERAQAMLRLLMSDPPATYLEVAAGLGIPIGSIGPTRQRCLRALRARCLSAGIEL
ncbi:MAG: RNA polymerase sigma factor [Acidimicrobiales bacterium]